MKTIDDLGDLSGKRVLVRSDLNVPLDGTTITDDGRAPLAASGLKLRARLEKVAASLDRVGAKGGCRGS